VDSGADLFVTNTRGETALVFALKALKNDIAIYVLDQGIEYSEPDSRGVTPLRHALQSNQFELVTRMIGDADVNAVTSYHGEITMFMNAVRKGHLGIVRLMLEKGADISLRSTNGNTAIFFAAAAKRPEVVELLVLEGADVNTVNARGETPIYESIKSSTDMNAQKLLASGADFNHQNDDGITPLMFAVNRANFDITRMLLVAGADISLRDNEGDTVFEYAAARPDKAINKLLDTALTLASGTP
jgi:ankyrin repeat protein